MSEGGIPEIKASSKKGFDDAVRVGVERAHRTHENVRSARVVAHRVIVRDGKIAEYRVVMRVAVDAIVSVEDSQNIVEFNQGAESIFGYTRDEVLGRSLTMLIPEKYRAGHEHHVRTFADSPTAERMMGERDRVVGLKKDGTEFPAEASIVKHVVAGNRRYSVMIRDVSES